MLSFRRVILVATLVCQVFAGSLASFATANAASASHSSATSAPCHGDAPAEQPAAQHPCGCDAGACQCPCLHVAALSVDFHIPAPALIPATSPLPATVPLMAERSTSVFKPPI